MLILACHLVQVFIPLSLFQHRADGERKREGKAGNGEKTNWQRDEEKAREGGRAGEVSDDTPADDRLMNLWMKSAGAVLWTAADNNKR